MFCWAVSLHSDRGKLWCNMNGISYTRNATSKHWYINFWNRICSLSKDHLTSALLFSLPLQGKEKCKNLQTEHHYFSYFFKLNRSGRQTKKNAFRVVVDGLVDRMGRKLLDNSKWLLAEKKKKKEKRSSVDCVGAGGALSFTNSPSFKFCQYSAKSSKSAMWRTISFKKIQIPLIFFFYYILNFFFTIYFYQDLKNLKRKQKQTLTPSCCLKTARSTFFLWYIFFFFFFLCSHWCLGTRPLELSEIILHHVCASKRQGEKKKEENLDAAAATELHCAKTNSVPSSTSSVRLFSSSSAV